jgi:hypothetical protein
MDKVGVDSLVSKLYKNGIRAKITKEDTLVAELERVGVHYLTRRSNGQRVEPLSPEILLVQLVRQPSSRVRNAIIALFLVHPEYKQVVPIVLHRLRGASRSKFKTLYTAAVFLQRLYAAQLRSLCPGHWAVLPDIYSGELIGEITNSPQKNLELLGQAYQTRTGEVANWSGTFDDVARHLLRQLELEARWSK